MEHFITFVGLDVHKVSISVALAEGGDRGEARVYGEIANRPDALRKLMSRLAQDSRELRFCYEAGPCGYGIQRQLTDAGHNCVVVAPALIPRKPGDRIKTNRRDALKLARLHRAGELTSVWVPDPAHEAMRDLVRARLAAVRALRHARQQLSGFLLRQGRHYSRTAWGPMHRRWLAGLHFEQAAHHVVLEDMIATVEAADGLSRSGALGAFQWRPLGVIALRPVSVVSCSSVKKACPSRSARQPGRRSSGFVAAIAD